MARFLVPVLVLVALVGGYVVGQQPATPHPTHDGWTGAVTVDLRVGRYAPFQPGLMIDTTNGTLYAMEGNPTRWKVVAEFGETTQAGVVAPATRTNP